MAAVQQNGDALQYVKIKNDYDSELSATTYLEICMTAVQQNGRALEHVLRNILNLTNTRALIEKSYVQICMVAVRQNYYVLTYVDRLLINKVNDEKLADILYDEICMEAVSQNGYALQLLHVVNKTSKICIAAVKNNGMALEYIGKRTILEINKDASTNIYLEICKEAVQENGCACVYIKDQILNEMDYVYIVYTAIFKCRKFEDYDGYYHSTEERINRLQIDIEETVIDKVLVIRKRSIKRAM
jgi:hypothetical protein